MLLHGATTCVDFFYLQDEGNANAEAVIQAARDTGIRLVLARAMYDWDGAPARYREAPRDAARRVRELIDTHASDPTIAVQPAPHSPHGASPAMIRAGFEVAAAADTRFHIHVAEGQYEGQRTLAEYGVTPIRYLDRLGVLGPRMIGVHCVWLDDQEGGPDGRARRRPRLLPVVQYDPRRRHHPHHRDAAPRRPHRPRHRRRLHQ